MEDERENPEPPGRQTRRASKTLEEVKKVEEERIFNEFHHVMMVGVNEEVRQRAADRDRDDGRLTLDALERGEGGGGDASIKQEVERKEVEEEEGAEGRRQELAALQRGAEVEEEDILIKEEVPEGEEEEMLAANPFGSLLAESQGQAVVIPTNCLEELEMKEEEQDEVEGIEGSHLAKSGGGGEGEGTEQEPILIEDEEDEFVAESEVVGDEETDQVNSG